MGTRDPYTPSMRLIALAILLLAFMPAIAAEDDPAPKGRAVIVRVSETKEVAGHVEFESDDVIVLKRLDGEIEAFPRSRLQRVIEVAPPRDGERATVVLKTGVRHVGELVRNDFEFVAVLVEGVRIEFPRDKVDTVHRAPPFAEELEHRRSRIDPARPETHLDVCRWLVSIGKWDEAAAELEALLERTPYPPARTLQRRVLAQVALIADRNRPRDAEADDSSKSGSHKRVYPITERDVNIVRVYEIDFSDPPRVAVPRPTIARILEYYSKHELIPANAAGRMRLYRAEPLEIVRLMFKLQSRELYEEIEVLSEPISLRRFRQRIHDTWLIHNCATSGCHGKPDAPGFELVREDFRDARVRIANLLRLERTPTTPPLIDWERPLDSLLIQSGLPRNLARHPHPDVQGWQPVFRSLDDPLVRESVAWMEMMYHPRPIYPVDYPPAMPPSPTDRAAPAEPAGDAGDPTKAGDVTGDRTGSGTGTP